VGIRSAEGGSGERVVTGGRKDLYKFQYNIPISVQKGRFFWGTFFSKKNVPKNYLIYLIQQSNNDKNSLLNHFIIKKPQKNRGSKSTK
jgi:hypothetical protein